MMKRLCLGLLVPLVALAQDYRPQPTDAEKARMASAVPSSAQVKVSRPRQVLVYCDHKGFYHSSIPFANEALKVLGKATGAFEVTVTTDASCFEPENLKKYDVIFLNNNTSRSPWGQKEYKNLPAGPERERLEAREARLRQAFLDFVRVEGKGLVGIHAATDAMYDWPEYGEMLGGFFNAHPWSERVGVELCDAGHPTMRGWRGVPFYINDEIYQQRAPYSRDRQRVLMRLDVARCDMTKKDIRRTDGDFALAWIKRYGKGRVGYIAFGHRHELFWNRGMLTMMLDFIQYAAGDLKVDDRPSNELDEAYLRQSAAQGFERGVREMVADLADYRYSVDDTVARQIDALANRLELSSDGSGQAEQLARLLAEQLTKPETSVDARNFILRQVSRLGGPEAVPAVAAQLRDAATADMAMYCLQRLPGEQASEALLAALKAQPERAGALASMLGQRRYAAAVPALAALLGDARHGEQAALALGAIGDEAAAQALVAALPGAKGGLRLAVLAGLADCAEVAVAGEALAAATDAPMNLRATGLAARLRRAGAAGIPDALEALAGGDEFVCAAVTQALREIPGGVAAALAKIDAGLPSAAAVFVLKAASDLGDASLEGAVLKALGSADGATARAAATALEHLGGRASVLPLASVSGAAEKAAARSLVRMRGEGVTEVLVREIGNASLDVKVRASLLRTLGVRKEGAASFYVGHVLSGEAALAKEAVAALALTAKEGDASELARVIAQVKGASDRGRLVKIAVAVGRRAEKPEAYVGVMLAALKEADQPKLREAFVTVLGALGRDEALPALTAELKHGDASVKRAAILALSDWPNAEPLPALRAVSVDEQASPAHRVLALRGYAHLLALPSRRPIAETLTMYREAFALAKTPQEKQSLVGGLGDLIHPDAFRLAMEYRQVPELADEATLSAAKIWKGLNGARMQLSASHGGNAVRNAIDGNRKTRWTSGKVQAGNEWFQIDLGYETTISEIYLDAGDEGNDYPAVYEVYVSSDGQSWGDKPVLAGRGNNRQMTLKLNAYGRYIKLVQKGQYSMFWSICEMSVNGIPGRRGERVSADQLRLTASHNAGALDKMLDGNRNTRWDSGTAQRVGQWLTIELPKPMEVRRIVMDAGSSRNDFPSAYRIDVSDDGKTWRGPFAFGKGDGAITTALPLPAKGKFVKITLTADVNPYYWSIHELSVFAE